MHDKEKKFNIKSTILRKSNIEKKLNEYEGLNHRRVGIAFQEIEKFYEEINSFNSENKYIY